MKVRRLEFGSGVLFVAVDFAFGKALQYAVEEVLRTHANPGTNRRAIALEVRRRIEEKIARDAD